MTPLVETRGLERTFGAVVAAADINVRIDQGETLGIIGANGAGKTTFVNMITGHLAPSSGTILFDGNDITSRAPRQITRLGVSRSFQIAQIFPEMSVIENMLVAITIADELRLSPIRRAVTFDRTRRAREALADFGLIESEGRLAGTLPQGTKKLLDIAMAMASRPKLMLLDEPTSGVSSEEKLVMMDHLMGALRQFGTTIIFIEHDMDIIAAHARRILAFYEGRIVADGPTAEVLANASVRTHVIGGHREKETQNA
jgi:branched-chain amino acid transport system ATP-binding protein